MKQLLKIANISQTEFYARIGAKAGDDPAKIKKLRKRFVAKNHPDRAAGNKVDPKVFADVMSYKPNSQNSSSTKLLTGKVETPKPPQVKNSIMPKKVKNNALAVGGGIAGAGVAANNIKNISNKETRSKGIKGALGQTVGTVGGAVLGKKLGLKNKNIFGAASGLGAVGGALGSKL